MNTNTTDTTAVNDTCPHCGFWHTGQCSRIKAIEYHENGAIKRVEYHDNFEEQ